jgi:hypothetical protein
MTVQNPRCPRLPPAYGFAAKAIDEIGKFVGVAGS